MFRHNKDRRPFSAAWPASHQSPNSFPSPGAASDIAGRQPRLVVADKTMPEGRQGGDDGQQVAGATPLAGWRRPGAGSALYRPRSGRAVPMGEGPNNRLGTLMFLTLAKGLAGCSRNGGARNNPRLGVPDFGLEGRGGFEPTTLGLRVRGSCDERASTPCLKSRRPPVGGLRLAWVVTSNNLCSGRAESNRHLLLRRNKVTPQDRPNC
jgi:hypothetical protein